MAASMKGLVGAPQYEPLGADPQTADPNAEKKAKAMKACGCACLTCCGAIAFYLIVFVIILYTQLNTFQAWAAQHPGNVIGWMYQPTLSVIEGLWSCNPLYLDNQRMHYGNVFMLSGQVLLGSYRDVETALTSPQARTFNLGASPLIPEHLSWRNDGQELTFLLGISDKLAGGNGDHEAFRESLNAMVILHHDTAMRQDDATSDRLLKEFGEEYIKAISNGPEGLVEFCETPEKGLMRFNIRYMHYVLFGLDPDHQSSIDVFTQAYYGIGGPKHYLKPLGSFASAGTVSDLMKQAADFYYESPQMQKHIDIAQDTQGLTRHQAAEALTAILCIAALQGPYQLSMRLIGYKKLPDYQSAAQAELPSPATVDMVALWDKLDLEDDDAIELHILETSRIYAPVSTSARVAVEPFTTTVAGYDRTFPAGTLITIPMSLAMMDPERWGPTRYEFNPRREGLKDDIMAFASAGNRTAGRACPGRDLSMVMLRDMLQTLGKARRESSIA